MGAYPRVLQELHAPRADLAIEWRVRGEQRRAVDGSLRPALHLQVNAALPLSCQRCLDEVTAPIDIDRHFVFVPDEEKARAKAQGRSGAQQGGADEIEGVPNDGAPDAEASSAAEGGDGDGGD